MITVITYTHTHTNTHALSQTHTHTHTHTHARARWKVEIFSDEAIEGLDEEKWKLKTQEASLDREC